MTHIYAISCMIIWQRAWGERTQRVFYYIDWLTDWLTHSLINHKHCCDDIMIITMPILRSRTMRDLDDFDNTDILTTYTPLMDHYSTNMSYPSSHHIISYHTTSCHVILLYLVNCHTVPCLIKRHRNAVPHCYSSTVMPIDYRLFMMI